MTDDLVTWLRAQLDVREREIQGLLALGEMSPRLGRELLAEVDAKRRIIDFLEYDRIDGSKAGGPPETIPGRRPAIAHPVLRMLALPYADRPGYRDEWRP